MLSSQAKYHSYYGCITNAPFTAKSYFQKWNGLVFIGVCSINRTLHGRTEIRNFFSCLEKIFHSFAALTREIFFQHSKRNFVSPRDHVISSIYYSFKILAPIPRLISLSKIQLVVYYQYCVLIGWATTRLYVIAHW